MRYTIKKRKFSTSKRERQRLYDEFDSFCLSLQNEHPDWVDAQIEMEALDKLYDFYLRHWHFDIRKICTFCHLDGFYKYNDKETDTCQKVGYNSMAACHQNFYLDFIEFCEESDIPAKEIISIADMYRRMMATPEEPELNSLA